jgi:hypothetical protein
MTRTGLLREFANSPREVHSIAAGGSFGALTTFLYVSYSRTVGVAFGLLFLSAVVGVRFYRLLRASDTVRDAARYWSSDPSHLLKQLRAEGHYTVTAFTLVAAVVYVALVVF